MSHPHSTQDCKACWQQVEKTDRPFGTLQGVEGRVRWSLAVRNRSGAHVTLFERCQIKCVDLDASKKEEHCCDLLTHFTFCVPYACPACGCTFFAVKQHALRTVSDRPCNLPAGDRLGTCVCTLPSHRSATAPSIRTLKHQRCRAS